MELNDLKQKYVSAKRALFDCYYSDLNSKQREAVYSVNGPLLVLAGAGSGKTTVLVRRIAHIIKFGDSYYGDDQGKIPSEAEIEMLKRAIILPKDQLGDFLSNYAVSPCKPWEVLAFTFTNKAADEMKERLSLLLDTEVNGLGSVSAGTFHSICVRILRRFGESVGLTRDFTIYDDDDSKKVVKEALKKLNLDEKVFTPKAVLSFVSKAKDMLLYPNDQSLVSENNYMSAKLAKIYSVYQKMLEDANAVDFDDIIMKTVKLLSENEDVRNYYQNRFKYVCVDEYQDTNYAQFMLTVLLSGKYRNLMVVGDDDQSIYKFRGATIENILGFDKNFEDAKVVKLEQNYRSTKIILDAANSIISNNKERHGKSLWTNRRGGEKITLKELDDQNSEAMYITDEIIKRSNNEERKFSDFAVLYRTNAQSNSFEKILAKSAIPYKILGGTRFYDRKEIKDIVAYLCLIHNNNDNLRLMRIINEPKRKIGNTTIAALSEIASAENTSMLEIIRKSEDYTALTRVSANLKSFSDVIDSLCKISESESISTLVKKTIEMTGYENMLIAGGEEEKERLDNVYELVSNAVDYEKNDPEASLAGFLEDIALVSDVDNYDKDADAIVLMTIHSAKGLEFPVVFLPGMENGIFPSIQSMYEKSEKEEERRLAYVALTRAKDKLYITHVRERLLYGSTQYNRVSEFVEEIPKELIDEEETARRKNYFSDERRDYSPSRSYGERFANNQTKTGAVTSAFVPSAMPSMKKEKTLEVFKAGDTVVHPKFGIGTVISAQNMSGDILYSVAFDDSVGTKRLMATTARLKKYESC